MMRRADMAPKNPTPSTSEAELRSSGVARLSIGFTVGTAIGVVAVGLSTFPVDPTAGLVLVAAYGALGAVVATIDAAIGWIVDVVFAGRAGARPHVHAAIGWAAFAGAAAVPVGASLSAGPWVERNGLSLALRIVTPLAIGSGTGVLAWALTAGPADDRFTRRAARAPALAVGCAFIALDARVLVGLYPAAHATWLSLAMLVGWLGAGVRGLARLRPKSTTALSLGVANMILLASACLAYVGGGASLRGALVLASPHAASLFARFSSELPPLLQIELERIGRSPVVDEGPAIEGRLRAPADANVLWITIDTLRADMLPPARHEQMGLAVDGDTPRLDAFLASSFRFRRAYAPGSMTHLSIPATFRSIEVFEDPIRTGVSLPARMRALGLSPIASAEAYFVEGQYEQARRLLDDFDEVVVYGAATMGEQAGSTLSLLERHAHERFFAWIHLYAVHDPGFDGEQLDPTDGPWRERYLRALRWLDGQFGSLLDGIRALGLEGRTVVVLTSDHGEGLDEHGYAHHGASVFEEEVRVPLAIRVPGTHGRVVERTVGNIDIVPSLLELLSAPSDPELRGRSFVALLSDDDAQWRSAYFMENGDASQYGVVRGTDKLVFDRLTGTFMRYDLASDPDERRNRYSPDGSVDAALRSELVRRKPQAFSDELRSPRVRWLLEEGLARARALRTDDVDFLLRLLALSPTDRGIELARRIVETGEDDTVRARAVRHLGGIDRAGMAASLSRRLDAVRGTSAEDALIEALASEGAPAVAAEIVATRCGALATTGSLARLEPWLKHLLAARGLQGETAVRAAAPVLERHANPDGAEAERLALLVLASARFGEPPPEGVVTSVLTRLTSTSAEVRRAAASALGALGGVNAIPELRARAEDAAEDARVRHAASEALVRLESPEAAAPAPAGPSVSSPGR